jgi:shikimate kinase
VDNIILVGMPGAGKSTVGVLLAKTLGYAFLDTDLVIQAGRGPSSSSSWMQGPGAFLEAEADAVCAVSCRCTVIATGGSAVYRTRAVERLRELGRVVYLRLPLDEVERRLNNIGSRGIAMAPARLWPTSTPIVPPCTRAAPT